MTHIVKREKQKSSSEGAQQRRSSLETPMLFSQDCLAFTHSESEEFGPLLESAIFRSCRWNNMKQTAKAQRNLRVISSFFLMKNR